MDRRKLLVALLATATSLGAASRLRRFACKIKTETGGIIGNVVIEAADVEAAKVKLTKRYPSCTILGVTVK